MRHVLRRGDAVEGAEVPLPQQLARLHSPGKRGVLPQQVLRRGHGPRQVRGHGQPEVDVSEGAAGGRGLAPAQLRQHRVRLAVDEAVAVGVRLPVPHQEHSGRRRRGRGR